MKTFDQKLEQLYKEYLSLVFTPNTPSKDYNGIYQRYEHPVFTANHVAPNWKYDLNESTNPLLQQRLGVNATLNPGAILWQGKHLIVIRMEGWDRKSFFAIAESDNGIDGFRLWDEPIVIPDVADAETNAYDMRLVSHEDGWIYGTYCAERKDPKAKAGDESAATASCGVVRSKDLKTWERLPDLITYSGQQRNVVLHPEFVNGKYALYTRPQDGFIDTGKGGGIGFGFTDSMERAEIKEEVIVDSKRYHTITEVKNGQGPAPIKTGKGWLHLAHGVRNTAAGLRYVLYMFVTALDNPAKVIARPSGYFMAPEGAERIGDVSNVLFVNGWIRKEDGSIYIYYASSDTRIHVATTSEEQLLDYCFHTPEDPLKTAACVKQRIDLINNNKKKHEEMLKALQKG